MWPSLTRRSRSYSRTAHPVQPTSFVDSSPEKLSERNLESVRELNQGGEAQVLLAAFDCSCERTSQTGLMRELFLRPLPHLAEFAYAAAELLPDCDWILHPPYDQRMLRRRLRRNVGRSIVGDKERARETSGEQD